MAERRTIRTTGTDPSAQLWDGPHPALRDSRKHPPSRSLSGRYAGLLGWLFCTVDLEEKRISRRLQEHEPRPVRDDAGLTTHWLPAIPSGRQGLRSVLANPTIGGGADDTQAGSLDVEQALRRPRFTPSQCNCGVHRNFRKPPGSPRPRSRSRSCAGSISQAFLLHVHWPRMRDVHREAYHLRLPESGRLIECRDILNGLSPLQGAAPETGV